MMPQNPPDSSLPESTEGSSLQAVRGSRIPFNKLWLAVPTVLAAAGLAWWFRDHTPPLNDLPQPDITPVSHAIQELIRETQQAVTDSRNSADAWGKLGMVLLAYEFDRDAVPCFQNAAALDPDEFRWHYFLGLATTAINRETAISAFQNALTAKPGDPWTQARLGELHLADGKLTQALSFLENAVQSSSRPSARTLQALARTQLSLGDVDAAKHTAEKAVNAAPNSRMALEVLAQIQHRLRDPGAAVTLARLQELPDQPLPWNDPHAGYVLAQRLASSNAEDRMLDAARSGNVAAALEAGERAMRDSPDNHAIALRLSELYTEAGDLPRAISILEEERKRHPNQAELCFRLGVIRSLQEDWATASQCFQQATQLSADFMLAWYNYGQCLVKLDRPSEASSAFAEAVRLSPEHKAARLNLVRLLLQQNHLLESQRHLKVLQNMAPDDAEVQELTRRYGSLSGKATGQE